MESIFQNILNIFRHPCYIAILHYIHVNRALLTQLPASNGKTLPAHTRRWRNVGLMLGKCRRRWANINPISGQRLVLLDYLYISKLHLCYFTN